MDDILKAIFEKNRAVRAQAVEEHAEQWRTHVASLPIGTAEERLRKEQEAIKIEKLRAFLLEYNLNITELYLTSMQNGIKYFEQQCESYDRPNEAWKAFQLKCSDMDQGSKHPTHEDQICSAGWYAAYDIILSSYERALSVKLHVMSPEELAAMKLGITTEELNARLDRIMNEDGQNYS